MSDDLLHDEIIRLSTRLAGSNIPLFIGGGYGLVLKARYLRVTQARTLRELPFLRSTDDLDVFLASEVLTHVDKMRVLRQTIATLGFEPSPAAQYYQFRRTVYRDDRPLDIKLDLLAAPPNDNRVIVDTRRVRAKAFRDLHAHAVPEAMGIEEKAIEITLVEQRRASVFIPHPFSHTLLKLFALRDQIDQSDLNQGTRHAFDLFATWSMLVRQEWDDGAYFRERFATHPILLEAAQIVKHLFGSVDAPGSIRLRQHFKGANESVEFSEIKEFTQDVRRFIVGPDA